MTGIQIGKTMRGMTALFRVLFTLDPLCPLCPLTLNQYPELTLSPIPYPLARHKPISILRISSS